MGISETERVGDTGALHPLRNKDLTSSLLDATLDRSVGSFKFGVVYHVKILINVVEI